LAHLTTRHSRTGHALQHVVPDFQPDRLKVTDHALKHVACGCSTLQDVHPRLLTWEANAIINLVMKTKAFSGSCCEELAEEAVGNENTVRFTDIPHANRLFIDFLYHFDRVSEFYRDPCPSVPSLQRLASEITSHYHQRSLLVDVLRDQNQRFGSGDETQRNIERLSEPDSVAIVTGQQAGLFTGPVFTFHKAITVLRCCDELQQQGIKAVPVFWINSEDHDFDEVNHCGVVGRDGSWVEVQYTANSEDAGRPISEILLNNTIGQTIEGFLAALPPSEFAPQIEADLRASYVEGARFVDGFARLLARVFSGSGLILFDPSDARLKPVVADLFRQTIVRQQELSLVLSEQTEKLTRLGHRPQIHVSADGALVFMIENGKRRAVVHQSDGFSLKGGEAVFTEDELAARIVEQPSLFSPNVALRPVVQDTLLPTLAYIGGPNEIAYFAQLKPLYETFGKIQPLLLPRASLTLIEQRYAKTMEKYDLTFQDLFAGVEAVLEKAAERTMNEGGVVVIDEARDAIKAEMERVRRVLAELDPTLGNAASKAEEAMAHHVEKLRKSYLDARARRDQIMSDHIRRLAQVLYPNKNLQEREVNAFYFFARYGYGLIERLRDAIEVGSGDHRLLFL
jgi:bacillithiol biosynthesis cysteine-adding enzyme BshC